LCVPEVGGVSGWLTVNTVDLDDHSPASGEPLDSGFSVKANVSRAVGGMIEHTTGNTFPTGYGVGSWLGRIISIDRMNLCLNHPDPSLILGETD
jgi:hypothetical protein